MASKSDATFAWLKGLSYAGSLADMQYTYLVGQCFGQGKSTAGTSADLQVRLGLKVKDVLTAP